MQSAGCCIGKARHVASISHTKHRQNEKHLISWLITGNGAQPLVRVVGAKRTECPDLHDATTAEACIGPCSSRPMEVYDNPTGKVIHHCFSISAREGGTKVCNGMLVRYMVG